VQQLVCQWWSARTFIDSRKFMSDLHAVKLRGFVWRPRCTTWYAFLYVLAIITLSNYYFKSLTYVQCFLFRLHKWAPQKKMLYIIICDSQKLLYFSMDVIWGGARRSIMVKALCYIPEGRGFETRWDEWFLSNYVILPATLDPGVYSASNRNEYQTHKNNVAGA
jgi:hypothetical protein